MMLCVCKLLIVKNSVNISDTTHNTDGKPAHVSHKRIFNLSH